MVLLVLATCEIVSAECVGVLFGVSHMCGGSGHMYCCHKSGLADLVSAACVVAAAMCVLLL